MLRKVFILGCLAIFLTALTGSQSYRWKRNKYVERLEKGLTGENFTGLRITPNWRNNAVFDDIKVKTADLPEHWDWREFTATHAPRNQGSCGSCWAFGLSQSTEFIWQILHPMMAPPLELGVQALVSCSRYDCGGGYFDAFDYMQSKGMPLEADYPYTARNGSCKSYTPFMKITRWAYVGDAKGSPSTEQIKQAIYDHGPVAIVVAANSSWSGYDGGIYDSCNSSSINHLIAAVGWGKENGKEYLIALNSWGADWGEGGYMRTVFVGKNGRKCNAIGDTTAYAIVDGVENLREYLGIK